MTLPPNVTAEECRAIIWALTILEHLKHRDSQWKNIAPHYAYEILPIPKP